MIAIGAAVRALLLQDADVAAAATGGVHSDVVPLDYNRQPALVFTTWPIRPINTTVGRAGLEYHRLQLDAYAVNRAGADGLMELAAAWLAPPDGLPVPHRVVDGVKFQAFRVTPAGETPTYEKDTKLFRRSLDFKVQAAKAA